MAISASVWAPKEFLQRQRKYNEDYFKVDKIYQSFRELDFMVFEKKWFLPILYVKSHFFSHNYNCFDLQNQSPDAMDDKWRTIAQYRIIYGNFRKFYCTVSREKFFFWFWVENCIFENNYKCLGTIDFLSVL